VLGDSLLLVVERDNRRVQGFRLPGFETLGTFGDSLLRLPYGITSFRDASGSYMVYVTDNYERPDESVPPDAELGERVKQFSVRVEAGRIVAQHVRSFGDTTAAGAIRIAESIMVDAARQRLMIAEETETDSYIKVYDLAGTFTGQVFGRGLFPQQAEGIALYACGDSAGYWVATDQGDSVNTFHLFDRVSLAHVGSFSGRTTRRTDGIALTQRSFGPFASGALYGSHLDAALGALSWARIAAALGVRGDC
jgi:3-phytase